MPSLAVLAVLLCASPFSGALQQPYDYLDGLREFQRGFLDPGPIVSLGKSPALAEDIVGRVDVTTTFEGQELNTEYLYGLWYEIAQNPNETSLLGAPLNQTIQSLVIEPPIIFVSTITNLNYPTIDLILPVQIDMVLRFDDDLKIVSYDAAFRRWPSAFKYLLQKLAPQLAKEAGIEYDPNTTNELLSHKVARDVCPIATEYCVGKNQQYESYDECYNFIAETIPFGDPIEGGLNTAWCRYIHKNMVSFRPDIHCDHIGPSGGDMCIDREYLDTVNGFPFEGTLVAPNATIKQGDLIGMSEYTFDQIAKEQFRLVHYTTVAFYPIPAMIFFAILYIFANLVEYGLSSRSEVFRDMSFANQRNTVTYIINAFFTTVALALQLSNWMSAFENYTYVGTQAQKLTALIITELYLFEMIYRASMRESLLAHHFCTLVAIISLFTNLELTAHPAGITLGFIWLFQATTEQSIFVGLAMYRLRWGTRITRKILKFAAVQSFICKLTATIFLFLWWGVKLAHYTEPADILISVVVCVIGALLLATQAYGSWAVWCIATSLNKKEEYLPVTEDLSPDWRLNLSGSDGSETDVGEGTKGAEEPRRARRPRHFPSDATLAE